MNKPFTLYSAIWNDQYPLSEFLPNARLAVASTPDDLAGPGILIVHGGEDISPDLYQKPRSRRTGAGKPSRRDLIEKELILSAIKKNIPVFGICRGAQLMCALAGGYLIQDVTNHSGSHTVATSDGQILNVNSIHHQMMAPWKVDHELLAWTESPRSAHYDDGGEMVSVPCEPEAVWFPQMGMAIQWHPEMMASDSKASLLS